MVPHSGYLEKSFLVGLNTVLFSLLGVLDFFGYSFPSKYGQPSKTKTVARFDYVPHLIKVKKNYNKLEIWKVWVCISELK